MIKYRHLYIILHVEHFHRLGSREGAMEYIEKHRNIQPGMYNENRLSELPIPCHNEINNNPALNTDGSSDDGNVSFEEIIIPIDVNNFGNPSSNLNDTSNPLNISSDKDLRNDEHQNDGETYHPTAIAVVDHNFAAIISTIDRNAGQNERVNDGTVRHGDLIARPVVFDANETRHASLDSDSFNVNLSGTTDVASKVLANNATVPLELAPIQSVSVFQNQPNSSITPQLLSNNNENITNDSVHQNETDLSTVPQLPLNNDENVQSDSVHQNQPGLSTVPQLPSNNDEHVESDSVHQNGPDLSTVPQLPSNNGESVQILSAHQGEFDTSQFSLNGDGNDPNNSADMKPCLVPMYNVYKANNNDILNELDDRVVEIVGDMEITVTSKGFGQPFLATKDGLIKQEKPDEISGFIPFMKTVS